MVICFENLNEKQTQCAGELTKYLHFEISDTENVFTFQKRDGGIRIEWDGTKGNVFYGKDHHFARCVGLIVEKLRVSDDSFVIEENPMSDTLGYMIDCSRNGAVHFDAFRELTCRLALMGYSMIQLYTEDTFEMEEYPYFGYMRPRYSVKDIQEMDVFADMMGIELVPCIQTLAHMDTFLQWQASAHLKDIGDILLTNNEATYTFIDCIFKTMAKCYKTRRINIGLDEAHYLGRGRYLDKFGYEHRNDIFKKHLMRVFDIARKNGFRPMMWSDMFFRCSTANGVYYSADYPIKEEFTKDFPEDVDIIFWIYRNVDASLLDGMFKLHKTMTDNIVFAGGAWKWHGFSPNNRHSEKTSLVQFSEIKHHKINELLLTAWSDNGSLASIYSCMPIAQLWAEMCYTETNARIKERFFTCMDGDYDAFFNMDMGTIVEGKVDEMFGNQNPGLYLLYQDILTGLFDMHIPPNYKEHCAKWAEIFDGYAKQNDRWAHLFILQRDLLRVLELKATVGVELYRAYHAKDTETIRKIAFEVIPEIERRMEIFMETVVKNWHTENQTFGLDSLEIKLGGTFARIKSAKRRLLAYLNGEVSSLPELERERLPFKVKYDPENPMINCDLYIQNVTTNVFY